MCPASAAGAKAEHFGVDAGPARLGMFQFFEHQHAGPFAEHEAVAIRDRTDGWPWADRRCVPKGPSCSAKPLTPIGVIAASVPPVIITSASSY